MEAINTIVFDEFLVIVSCSRNKLVLNAVLKPKLYKFVQTITTYAKLCNQNVCI